MDVQPFKCKQNLWEGRLQRKVCSRLGRQWARSPDEFCKVEEVFFSSNSWTFAYQKDKTPASPQIHIYPFQTLAKAKRISSFLACILYQSHFPSGSPKHWRTCKCMVTKEISCNLGLGGGVCVFNQPCFLYTRTHSETFWFHKETGKARSRNNITPLWQQSNMELSSEKFKREHTRCYSSYLL